MHQFVVGNQRGNGLQVRTGQHHEAVGCEHSDKLFQCSRYFVRMQMFEVVAGKNSIHAFTQHPVHVGDAIDHIGLGARVYVQTDFLPLRVVKSPGGGVFAFVAAPPWHGWFLCRCLGGGLKLTFAVWKD